MFGFLTVLVLAGIFGFGRSPEHLAVLIFPVFMGVLFYFILKATVFDLVDEVWDAGDHLVVRNPAKNPMVEKLIDRVDAARRKHGG